MSYIKILGFGIMGLISVMLMRRFKDDFAAPVSLIVSVLLTSSAIGILMPVFEYLKTLGTNTGAESYLTLIFKSCGVSVITSIACDICRDSGENAIAAKLELCGKSTVLLLALPLIKNIFESTYAILS